MKAMLMNSYNPAQVVEVMQITKELIEEFKTNIIKLSDFKSETKEVKQILCYEDVLMLSETSKERTDRINSDITFDVYLKEGDLLVKTDEGYKVNQMPIKILTDKQVKHVEKFNKLGD